MVVVVVLMRCQNVVRGTGVWRLELTGLCNGGSSILDRRALHRSWSPCSWEWFRMSKTYIGIGKDSSML